MRINLTIKNEVVFDREISRFSNGAQDFRIIAPALLTAIREIVRAQFAAQGRGLSGSWAKLSKAYAKAKAKKYPGKPILQASGKMFESLMKRTEYSIVSIRKTELLYGTRRHFASFHQDGTPKMPRRPIFDLREEDKNQIIKAAQARLVKLAKTGR